MPLMGVNFGRLGFLASFTPEQFKEHFESFVAGKLPVSSRHDDRGVGRRRETEVPTCGRPTHVAAKRRFVATALNDAVITAGPPFHMIELELRQPTATAGVHAFGDGVIVATPSGSTAYNVVGGRADHQPQRRGVLHHADVPAQPPFRPVVHAAKSRIILVARRVNAGTTLSATGRRARSSSRATRSSSAAARTTCCWSKTQTPTMADAGGKAQLGRHPATTRAGSSSASEPGAPRESLPPSEQQNTNHTNLHDVPTGRSV